MYERSASETLFVLLGCVLCLKAHGREKMVAEIDFYGGGKAPKHGVVLSPRAAQSSNTSV